MNCTQCSSDFILTVNSKSYDMNRILYKGEILHEGYIPTSMPFGSGKYLSITLCGNCGAFQNKFPIILNKKLGARKLEIDML